MGPFLCLDTAVSTLILGTVTAALCPQGEAAFDEAEVGWGQATERRDGGAEQVIGERSSCLGLPSC